MQEGAGTHPNAHPLCGPSVRTRTKRRRGRTGQEEAPAGLHLHQHREREGAGTEEQPWQHRFAMEIASRGHSKLIPGQGWECQDGPEQTEQRGEEDAGGAMVPWATEPRAAGPEPQHGADPAYPPACISPAVPVVALPLPG